jgi:hypothetical protein
MQHPFQRIRAGGARPRRAGQFIPAALAFIVAAIARDMAVLALLGGEFAFQQPLLAATMLAAFPPRELLGGGDLGFAHRLVQRGRGLQGQVG